MNWRTDVKQWFHSLTVWWSGAQVFVGAGLFLIEQRFDLISPHLGKWSGGILMGLGLVNLWLRLRTSSAIAGTKAAKP